MGKLLPLAGLRVTELGHIVAGPTAGQILADLGADVIKVESPRGGDLTRNMPGSTAAAFGFFNRNKRSIACDLKGGGKEIFLKLAARSDIVIDNYSVGAVERLGIGYETVSKENAGLIWLSIKGFLPGPLEQRPMLDELAQMMGGLAYMTGTADTPMRAGASIIDMGAATYGVIAVLAALRQRDAATGGRGQRITAGLFETSVYWVGQWMAAAQFSGEMSTPVSVTNQSTRMGFAVYRLFRTADGQRIFIGITSEAHWDRFCRTFGLAELAADPRFRTTAGRMEASGDLNAEVEKLILSMSSALALDLLAAAQVPFAPLLRPDELCTNPQLSETDQLVNTVYSNGKTGRLPKLPFRADGIKMQAPQLAPALGQHTFEIMSELGYSEVEIANFDGVLQWEQQQLGSALSEQ